MRPDGAASDVDLAAGKRLLDRAGAGQEKEGGVVAGGEDEAFVKAHNDNGVELVGLKGGGVSVKGWMCWWGVNSE